MKKMYSLRKIFFFCFVSILLASCDFLCKKDVDFSILPVQIDDKWGYIDKKGKYVINPQFSYADYFRNGLAMVTDFNGKVGFINKSGKFVVNAQYKQATPFSDGLAFVVFEGDYPTCIDKSGETVFVLKQAQAVMPFSEGRAMFVKESKGHKTKFGYVDKKGNEVIISQYDDARSFSDGLAAVKLKDKWGFIDKTGKMVINPQFEEVTSFRDGLAAFVNGDRWGYVDKSGKYVINPQFEDVGVFCEGKALFLSGEMFGFIDKDGKIVINPQFDEVGDFKNGYAYFLQNEKIGFIDKKGKIVINPQFEDATSFLGNVAFVENGGKWGLVDKNGKYVVNPQFDNINEWYDENEDSYDGYTFVESDYYDATEFLAAFFKKAGVNEFDDFTASSTLKDIANNSLYEDVQAYDETIASVVKRQKLTDDISIEETLFYFNDPIYNRVTTYVTYWWGGSYASGSTKKYNFNEKIAAIEYIFDLSGDTYRKGSAIATALKKEIEKRYHVTMESLKGQYVCYQNNKLSFGIRYMNGSVSLFVGFDDNKMREIFKGNSSKKSDTVTEIDDEEDI